MAASSEYSVDKLLPFARLALQVTANGEIYAFMDGLFAQLEKAGFRGVQRTPQHQGAPYRYDYSYNCPQPLKDSAMDVFLYLMHRGMIAPETLSFPTALNFGRWRITSRGTEWANGAKPVPEDTAGYLADLQRSVPQIDSVILEYVQEGLSALVGETYFSAAVMLGAACEKEIYLLADALLTALAQSASQKKLEEALEGRSLFKLLNTIEAYLAACKEPRDIFDGAHRHLLSLFESIRVQRNDAVHPRSANVSEETVHHAYAAFPGALKKAEQLREWFGAHPASISI